MRSSLLRITALLIALMLCAFAPAEEGELSFLSTFAPAPTIAPTPAPTPAPEIPVSALTDDGQVRVLLQSFNNPTMLHLTLNGLYALEGARRAQFLDGTTVTLLASEGHVWLGVGGLWMDAGESVTLRRHGLNEEERGGFTIRESGRDNVYPGSLHVTVMAGALRCVLTMDVEEYLPGVVAYEMSDSWPVEALKAQAVAARTYVLSRKAGAGTRDYDVTDTTSDQVYRGTDAAFVNVAQAVSETDGEVGVYEGGYAMCYYTASNGGEIALPSDVWPDASDGYIERRADPYDIANPLCEVRTASFAADLSDNTLMMGLVLDALDAQIDSSFRLISITDVVPTDPVPAGSKHFTKLAFTARCSVLRHTPSPTLTPAPSETPATDGASAPGDTPAASDTPAPTDTPSPTPAPTEEEASVFELDTPAPTIETPVIYDEETYTVLLDFFTDVKEPLGLRISGGNYELVTAEKTDGGFTLTTRRFGHGVGMSQRGAQRMAGVEELSVFDILSFYYPGMALERMAYQRPAPTALEALPAGADTGYPVPTPSPAPLPEPQPGEYIATVNVTDGASMLNVRQMPTTSSAILDRFENGRQVIVTSAEDENGWVAIRTAELEGYVKREYLTTEE
ncbi:MAG: SpoIID/LytB domain-containing protein [Clostridiales bacterium]|nr:SpoIID/LytB domain-containing protein [Clostridiales bacterium]